MVPFRPDEFSRKGLTHLYDVLDDIGEMGLTTPPEVIAHIPNLVDLRRKQEEDDLGKIGVDLAESNHGAPIVGPFHNRAQLVKSQAQRRSVFDYSGKEYEGLKEQFTHLAGLIDRWGRGENHHGPTIS
jgi:chromosome partitioning protein